MLGYSSEVFKWTLLLTAVTEYIIEPECIIIGPISFYLPSLATTTPLWFYWFGYFRCIHKWDQASYFAILPYSLLLSPRQLNMSHPPFAWGNKLSPQNHQRWMKEANPQFLRPKSKGKLIIQETHHSICPLWYQERMLAQNTDGLRTSVPQVCVHLDLLEDPICWKLMVQPGAKWHRFKTYHYHLSAMWH